MPADPTLPGANVPEPTSVLLQVFIPDEEVAARKKQEPFDDWRVSALESAPARSSATAASDRPQSKLAESTSAPAAFSAGPQAAQQQSRSPSVPDWWDPPPVIHSSGAFKHEVMPWLQEHEYQTCIAG